MEHKIRSITASVPVEDVKSTYREQRLAWVREVMTDDRACERIVPSDLRILIGEIDRLRESK